MLDMGFADDMEIILGACTNPERQTCLFSATMPKWVSDVAKKYMRNPTTIDVVSFRF
jgi:superfamily II DNA/RNA helicase